MAARRVIVAGAGVGGCATALAADRAGAAVEVWERHRAPDPERGAFLTLATGGVTALRVLGALDAVDRRAARLTALRRQDVDGNTLDERALGDGSESFRLITRHDLCAALRSAVHDAGVPLLARTPAASMRSTRSSVRAGRSATSPPRPGARGGSHA